MSRHDDENPFDGTAVVTGVGAVTPFGVGVGPLLAGVRTGRRVFGPVTLFDGAAYGIDSASQIPDDPRLDAVEGARPSRILQTAVAEALDSAGLSGPLGDRTALVLGTTLGCDEVGAALHARRHGEEPDLRAVASSMADCGGRAVIDRWGIGGPWLAPVTACAAGTGALGLGLDLLRDGRADRVVAGGLDTLTELVSGGFASIGALSEECLPFADDEHRRGTVLGENAAVLVLERAADAERRGADPIGRVLGYGLSNDAHHMTAPHPEGAGAVLAMRRALQDAHVGPDEIDYVNAHGTGTKLNDPVELRALRRVLGERLDGLPVSSLKSQLGHGLSSAGAVEAVVTLAALHGGWLPPTAHRHPSVDPRIDLVQPHSRPGDARIALSNSFAFGGHAASVVLAAPDVARVTV